MAINFKGNKKSAIIHKLTQKPCHGQMDVMAARIQSSGRGTRRQILADGKMTRDEIESSWARGLRNTPQVTWCKYQ